MVSNGLSVGGLTITTPNHSNFNSWVLMDSVLYSPDRDTLHGAGCPNSAKSNSWVVVFVHGVGFLGGLRKVLSQNSWGVRVKGNDSSDKTDALSLKKG